MQLTELGLNGLKIVEPRVFEDTRGFFYESYNLEKLARHGIDTVFVQDNHSRSVAGTLRGLHYQSHPGQVKLVRVTRGEILDVTVDIRRDSPTLGRHQKVELSEANRRQLLIPIGFAHGFVVRSEVAEVQYKCSAVYDAETECGLAWDDPDLGIDWEVASPILSGRDQQNESFATYLARLCGE